jgi:putative glutamine amidotransferase
MASERARLRLGLTMRTAGAPDYHEPRDALARDWAGFMAFALPPNLGEAAVDQARDWRLDGLVLTGGDDLGDSQLRDQTETALLDHALASGLPVFGVCRGLQMIQRHFGGNLEPCSRERHVATRHRVTFRSDLGYVPIRERQAEVNSFHGFGVPSGAVKPPLAVFAESDEGWAEGLFCPGRPLAAVMWHPERERPYRDLDRKLVRALFGLAEDQAGWRRAS